MIWRIEMPIGRAIVIRAALAAQQRLERRKLKSA
jgi:hypothetical protein